MWIIEMLGFSLFGVYIMANAIVLINVLIAMLSNTFQLVNITILTIKYTSPCNIHTLYVIVGSASGRLSGIQTPNG